MINLNSLERLQKIHKRIKQENTGTPKEFAQQLGISVRLLYQLIEKFKETTNAPIGYDRKRFTYYYRNDFELKINISITVLNNNELIKIFGGAYSFGKNNSLHSLCSGQHYLSIV